MFTKPEKETEASALKVKSVEVTPTTQAMQDTARAGIRKFSREESNRRALTHIQDSLPEIVRGGIQIMSLLPIFASESPTVWDARAVIKVTGGHPLGGAQYRITLLQECINSCSDDPITGSELLNLAYCIDGLRQNVASIPLRYSVGSKDLMPNLDQKSQFFLIDFCMCSLAEIMENLEAVRREVTSLFTQEDYDSSQFNMLNALSEIEISNEKKT